MQGWVYTVSAGDDADASQLRSQGEYFSSSGRDPFAGNERVDGLNP